MYEVISVIQLNSDWFNTKCLLKNVIISIVWSVIKLLLLFVQTHLVSRELSEIVVSIKFFVLLMIVSQQTMDLSPQNMFQAPN